jgi:hypothetical protein
MLDRLGLNYLLCIGALDGIYIASLRQNKSSGRLAIVPHPINRAKENEVSRLLDMAEAKQLQSFNQ